MTSQYMHSNPLNEHNAPLAVSSKSIQGLNTGTGNMYQGQGGRAFPQSGGGMSQYHSFAGAGPENAYARGSYAPVTVGYNSITRGGGRRRRSSRIHKCAKCKYGRRGAKTYRGKKCNCKHSRSRSRSHSRSRRVKQQGGNGGYANAAYSIAGPGTGIDKFSSALANPAPHSAYNSCHPVA